MNLSNGIDYSEKYHPFCNFMCFSRCIKLHTVHLFSITLGVLGAVVELLIFYLYCSGSFTVGSASTGFLTGSVSRFQSLCVSLFLYLSLPQNTVRQKAHQQKAINVFIAFSSNFCIASFMFLVILRGGRRVCTR